jgi:hypothetical protein
MPCAVRQAYTESKARGMVQRSGVFQYGANNQRWGKDLCSCTPTLFCYALFCFQCLQAETRNTMDGSSCCYNFCFGTPCATYNMVRHGFGIQGEEFIDLCAPLLCLPCASERAYFETKTRMLIAKVGSCCC